MEDEREGRWRRRRGDDQAPSDDRSDTTAALSQRNTIFMFPLELSAPRLCISRWVSRRETFCTKKKRAARGGEMMKENVEPALGCWFLESLRLVIVKC